MAEAILFDFTKFVIGKLSSVILDELKLLLGVEEELDRIRSNLSIIQSVLRDAEKQQSTSHSVKNWLGKLQDVMYDIDDLVDEIETEIAIQNKNKGHTYKQVRKFFSRSNFDVLRLLWAHQIKNVCKKLDRVADERKFFVLFTDHFVDSSESSSRETHSKINESEILGRDEDRETIINSILSCADCESISVLPIVGSGAIGKTTLAKLIYNDDRIDDTFDKKLWVYVSQRFNMKKILRQIVNMVTGENYVQLTMEQLSLEQLRIRVCEALKDLKYFLILDDLWNEDSNEWRQLKGFLNVGAKGSMVVVTTRDLEVASMAKSVEVYKLSELSDETCLMMFMHLAFKDGEKIKPELLNLAKKIVEKSRGIPLLVTTLGNLLHGKMDEREWHIVINKLEEGHEVIMNVLKLSYEQLPSYLKLCFRVFSIYGKGTVIPAVDLIYKCMALGFLPFDSQGEPLESLEFIGWKCIDVLLSKSLFQKIKNEHIPVDDFGNLLMHDFVYDLAKSMAGDELKIIDCTTTEVSKNTRYIRLDEDYFSGSQSHQMLHTKAKKARLLMLKTSEHPLSKSFLQNIFSNLKCLRVLDLENSQFEELPRTVGYMKHLRYLGLQNNVRIKLLPNSICNLLNLQTLLLDGCTNLTEIPTDIGRLENLKLLAVTTQQEVLPQGIGFLSALRSLSLRECPKLAFLPLSTKQLENLDMLSIINCKEFNLAHESWSLEGLNSLHFFAIVGLPNLQKLPMGVKGLPCTSLEVLIICYCEGLTDIADWIQYYTSLRTLLIVRCPNVVPLPQNFSMLKSLENCHIEGYPNLDIGMPMKRVVEDDGL